MLLYFTDLVNVNARWWFPCDKNNVYQSTNAFMKDVNVFASHKQQPSMLPSEIALLIIFIIKVIRLQWNRNSALNYSRSEDKNLLPNDGTINIFSEVYNNDISGVLTLCKDRMF